MIRQSAGPGVDLCVHEARRYDFFILSFISSLPLPSPFCCRSSFNTTMYRMTLFHLQHTSGLSSSQRYPEWAPLMLFTPVWPI